MRFVDHWSGMNNEVCVRSHADVNPRHVRKDMKEIEKRVIERIDEKELVELATALGNITAPSGYEQPMADYVEDWLRRNGFHCYQQNLCEGRSNAERDRRRKEPYFQ